MKRTRHLILRTLSAVVVGLLLVQTGTAGQSAAGLVIQVLKANQGENLTEKELPPTKVRVMDRTGRVISGASVQFRAPDEGPTGIFLPDSRQITVTTDTQGMATAPPFRTNSKVGDYEIQIVASHGESVSRAAIPQTNLFKLKSASKKKFVILSAVIGGAAAAALAGKGGNAGAATSALDALAVTPTLNVGGSSVGVSTPTSTTPTSGTSTFTIDVGPPLTTTSTDTSSTPTVTTSSTPTVAAAPAPTTMSSNTVSTTTVQPTTVASPVPSTCKGKGLSANKKNC